MNIFKLFRKKTSKEIAKDRLKILLISDRVNCSPEMLEMIKNDISKVLSKYMKIDAQKMEIQISKTPSIFANIPIIDLNKQIGVKE
ncbi:MAG: cell division topological specificity factor MinE [Eubacteriales bacterium]